MVFRNCLGMIMSVSTLLMGRGAAIPLSLVNFCMADPWFRPALCHGEFGRASVAPPRAGWCCGQVLSAPGWISSVKVCTGLRPVIMARRLIVQADRKLTGRLLAVQTIA